MQARMLQRPGGNTFYIYAIVILMGCGMSDRGPGGGGVGMGGWGGGGDDTCDGFSLKYI